jgi:hypothetical protein
MLAKPVVAALAAACTTAVLPPALLPPALLPPALPSTALPSTAQPPQYLDSGAAASSTSGIDTLQCSQRPKSPVAILPSASSVSASRWRASVARCSSRRARGPGGGGS